METIKFRIFEAAYLVLVTILIFLGTLMTLLVGIQPVWKILIAWHDFLDVGLSIFTIIAIYCGIATIAKVCLVILPQRYGAAVELYTGKYYRSTSRIISFSVVFVFVLAFFFMLPMCFTESGSTTRFTIYYYILLCYHSIAGSLMILAMLAATWFMRHYRRLELPERRSDGER